MSTRADRNIAASVGDLSVLAQSWELSLRAVNMSDKTIDAYRSAVTLLDGYLRATGMPTAVTSIRREHCEAWMVWMRDEHGYALKSVKNRHCGAQQFFRWAEEEGEIEKGTSPMRNVKPPKVPESAPPVLADEQIAKMLDTCKGAAFVDRRDAAIIRVLIDTGLRRSEIAGLTWSDEQVGDVDLIQRTLHVLGKGGRYRSVGMSPKTAHAIDRYIRVRRAHPHAARPELWLGKRGTMTGSGILQMLKSRAEEAGIEGRVYTHLMRHTWASAWLADEGAEGDLMRLAGWRSRKMVDRYGSSVAEARAVEAAKRRSLGDRF